MDVLLIIALLSCVAWMVVCARKWQYWKAVAKLNRDELNQLTVVAHEHTGHSYDKGYMLGLRNGVEAMYAAAARAHASDMAMDVLRMEGHRLVGTPEHDDVETVYYT